MFRNKIPELCRIAEEPYKEVWNRTIGAGCGLEIVQKFARFEFAAAHIGTDGDVTALQSFLLSFTMFRPSRLSYAQVSSILRTKWMPRPPIWGS
jgi:hypothetical protein